MTDPAWCVPGTATPQQRADIILDRVYAALETPRVRELGVAIAMRARSMTERAAQALAFAQRVGYRPDPPDCDRYAPVEYTLDHGGDCDDLVPVVMAVAIAAGVPAAVVHMPQDGLPFDHVTAQLAPEGEWLWAEPSVDGAALGENPYDALRRVGRATADLGTAVGTGIATGIAANLLTIAIVGVGAWLLGRHALRGNPDVTPAQARAALRDAGARLPKGATLRELARGMTEEREHRDVTGGDAATTAKIALAHLRERPDYYRVLAQAMKAPRANPVPLTKRELAWRRTQRHGAIMRPGTFERIEREARARDYADPQAVAGAAYWRTVKAKHRRAVAAKRPGKPRSNPSTLPIPSEIGKTEDEVWPVYREEIIEDARSINEAAARYRREQLYNPTDTRAVIARGKALQQISRGWFRAQAARLALWEGPYDEGARKTLDASEKRARIAEAYIGAAVVHASSRESQAWKAIGGDNQDAALVEQKLRELESITNGMMANGARLTEPEARRMISDLGDTVGELLEASGLIAAGKAFDELTFNRPNADYSGWIKRLCRDYPESSACKPK